MAILRNKRAEKLAWRLYRYYRELSWADREHHEKYIWEPSEMAWNACQHLLVAEDWLKDVVHELKAVWQESFRSQK